MTDFKCMACGSTKDLFSVRCADGSRERWPVACEKCFEAMEGDMWISRRCWESLSPAVPFNDLPPVEPEGVESVGQEFRDPRRDVFVPVLHRRVPLNDCHRLEDGRIVYIATLEGRTPDLIPGLISRLESEGCRVIGQRLECPTQDVYVP